MCDMHIDAHDDKFRNTQTNNWCQVHRHLISTADGTGTLPAKGARHGVPRGKKNPLYLMVSQRLLHLRDASGLVQEQICEMAKLARSTVSHVESGEVTSKISTIEQLATAFGISPAYLAFGDDGHLRWRERRPRFGLDPDPPPEPTPAARPCENLYQGMGARLSQARKAKGLSMRGLGRAAHCTVAAISLLEAGTSVVLLSTCEDLAKALDVAPGWLAYGIGQGPSVN